jgi:hypothetical protein
VLNHGGSSDAPVTSHVVSLDADAHQEPPIPGTILAQGNGQLRPRTINISGLSPGRHKLSIRANCNASAGSTNSGVLAFFFNVP